MWQLIAFERHSETTIAPQGNNLIKFRFELEGEKIQFKGIMEGLVTLLWNDLIGRLHNKVYLL